MFVGPINSVEPDMIAEPVNGNVGGIGAYDDEIEVRAYEDVVENDDDINPVKPEPLPSNEPENEPEVPSVTISEPDTTELAFEIKPFFIINSFAIVSFFHCPKRS